MQDFDEMDDALFDADFSQYMSKNLVPASVKRLLKVDEDVKETPVAAWMFLYQDADCCLALFQQDWKVCIIDGCNLVVLKNASI